MRKSSLLHSRPKSTVGTPAYIAPEVLSRREYDGKVSVSLSHTHLLSLFPAAASEHQLTSILRRGAAFFCAAKLCGDSIIKHVCGFLPYGSHAMLAICTYSRRS